MFLVKHQKQKKEELLGELFLHFSVFLHFSLYLVKQKKEELLGETYKLKHQKLN